MYVLLLCIYLMRVAYHSFGYPFRASLSNRRFAITHLRSEKQNRYIERLSQQYNNEVGSKTNSPCQPRGSESVERCRQI